MRKYASLSWKRTWVWSSSRVIQALDLGPMTPEERSNSETLTTRYRDGSGAKRFKGNKSLKKSQYLASTLKLFIYFMFYRLQEQYNSGASGGSPPCWFLFRLPTHVPRHYTYKFAAKVVSVIPEARSAARAPELSTQVAWLIISSPLYSPL